MSGRYETVRVDELLVGDRISARSLGLDDERDLEVREAHDAADDPKSYVDLKIALGADDVAGLREKRDRTVERLLGGSAAAVERPDEEDVERARLYGMELLALQFRLSRGIAAVGFESDAIRASGVHPFDVTIDDVETTASDAIANVLVYLGRHGYDAEIILHRALNDAAAETVR